MTLSATRPGPFHHELVLHDGPGDLVDRMVTVAADGATRGDRLVVVGEPELVDALLRALPDRPAQVVRVPAEDRHPARDLHRFVRLLHQLGADDRVTRVVHQMPTSTPEGWREWRRYEAAVNVTLAPYAVTGTCAYDTRDLAPAVLEDLLATHPEVLTADGPSASSGFGDFEEHVATYLSVDPHPLAGTAPDLVVPDPTAAQARAAVRRVATGVGLGSTGIEAVVLATNEAVSNAHRHGRPPVVLRAWTGTAAITVSVTDSGTGPSPLVGLLPQPPRDAESGRGMAIVHHLLEDVHHRVADDGYTITFAVGGG